MDIRFGQRITLDAYNLILKDGQIVQAYKVTVFITIVGTILSMLMTMMIAYPLSLGKLKGKTFFYLFHLFYDAVWRRTGSNLFVN